MLERSTIKLALEANIANKASNNKKDIFQYWGLSPDTNTFIPDATKDDILPKEEDYFYVPFRMLSATIVAGETWRATDFSNKDVLKASVPLLKGLPVYLDHDTSSVLHAVGVIYKAEWKEAFTAKDGTIVPAGINGVYRIDAKTNAKLVRDLSTDMPVIQSTSVTVLFEWMPSHPSDSNGWNFEYHVGEIAKDGKMVCRQCTKILEYYEVSLVSLGADPFAKILDKDGNPINVEKSAVYNYAKKSPFSEDLSKEQIKQVENNLFEKILVGKNFLLHLSHNIKEQFSDNMTLAEILEKHSAEIMQHFSQNPNSLDNSVILAVLDSDNGKKVMAEKFGKEIETLLKETTESVTAIQTLQQSLSELEAKNTSLTEQLAVTAPMLDAKRKECLRLYGISVKGKNDPVIEKLISEATPDILASLMQQYGGTLQQEFQAVCTKCETSEHIEYKSSGTENTIIKNNSEEEPTSLEDIAKNKNNSTTKFF